MVGCVPVRQCTIRWVAVPFPSRRKALRVLPSLLDVALPFPLEQCVCQVVQFLALPTGCRVLAAVARQADLAAVLDQYRGLGLDPVLLDAEPLALWDQAVRRRLCGNGGLAFLVHLAGDASCLVVGRGAVYEAAHAFKADAPDQLNRLMRTYMAALPPGETAGITVGWCGPGAAEPGQRQVIVQACPDIPAAAHRVADAPATFLAEAVAERAVRAGAALRCNLRTGRDRHPWLARIDLRRALLPPVAATVAALALLGWDLRLQQQAQTAAAAAETQAYRLAETLAGESLGAARGQHAVDRVRRALLARTARLTPFARAVNAPVARTLAGILTQAEQRRISLEQMSLTPQHVEVRGTLPDWNAATPLQQLLRAHGYTTTIERDEHVVDERIPFRVAGGGTP